MAQPLKAPHLAGTETSLPGHRFPALSPRAARGAHAELRSPPPRVWLKARHPQPRGKANVCAAPRSPTAPPRGTARDGAEALTQPPRGGRADAGTAGPSAAVTCCHREVPAALGTAAFLGPRPGCAATERSSGRSRRLSSAKGRDADTRGRRPCPAPPRPARPAVGGPALTSRAGSGAAGSAFLHLPPPAARPVPSRPAAPRCGRLSRDAGTGSSEGPRRRRCSARRREARPGAAGRGGSRASLLRSRGLPRRDGPQPLRAFLLVLGGNSTASGGLSQQTLLGAGRNR